MILRTASLAVNRDNQQVIKIVFPFNREDLELVRSLPGRKYNPEGKYWIAPFDICVIKQLREWNYVLQPELSDYLRKSEIRASQIQYQNLEIPGLKGEIRPFQKACVAFFDEHNGRALCGDEMGTGKTIEALAWLQLHPELRPAIIVVPFSLKINWAREAQLWMTQPKTKVLSGGVAEHLFHNDAEIIIINYDVLASWLVPLKAFGAKVLITDECHYYKNNKAQRTKAVKQLAKGIPHFIALSGTPITNRPIEIYNAWHIINPIGCPTYWTFAMRYCGARNNGFGWDFNGASNIPELHERLKSVMIRRLKKDVLSELPDKTRIIVPIELNNWSEYKAAEDDFIAFVRRIKGDKAAKRASAAESLTKIEGLKQLAVQGKLLVVKSWIEDFLESGNKLVVFAVHKFVIEALMNAFPKIAVKLDGSVTGEARQKAVDDFQTNDQIRLFIGNIKAAGVGITLTAASDTATIELGWSPGEHDQAEDRVHRIGTKNAVNNYYLLAAGTIEERIAALIDDKRKILDGLLDGRETEMGVLLTELMKEYE